MNRRGDNLYDFSFDALSELMRAWNERPFRAKQIYRQLYVNLAEGFATMTDLSESLRHRLMAETKIGDLKHTSTLEGDGGLTRKAVFELQEGVAIESVLMVYPDRATVCVSSQVGCPMGCVFCATAKLGFLQDLTSGQMIEQVLWAARELKELDAPGAYPRKLSNVVFMGMGEPFNNYNNWWQAVERLHDPQGFNMGARRFTVSTVGLIPGIERLSGEKLPVNLAISLHAPDDALELWPFQERRTQSTRHRTVWSSFQ